MNQRRTDSLTAAFNSELLVYERGNRGLSKAGELLHFNYCFFNMFRGLVRRCLWELGFEPEAGNPEQPKRPDEALHVPFGNVQEIRGLLASPAERRL